MPHKASAVADPALRSNPVPSIDPNLETDTIAIQVKLCNLPPFHAVANQVLALSADPEVDLRRLASVMECDPAFAAEVLFLANSSLFGFSSRMQIVRHAVAILGLERIKALAVTVAMRAFLRMGGSLVGPCWRHSAACAIVAQEIAPIFEISTDRVYSVALMHDVGRLGLLRSYTQDMDQVLIAEYPDTDALLKAEREAVAVDHAEAGSWLVKYWELPQEFADICAGHHHPLSVSDSPLLQCVKMACRAADALGFSAVHYTAPLEYTNLLRVVPPNQQRKFPAEADLRKIVEEKIRSLEA